MSQLADLQQRFQQCLLHPQEDLIHPWIAAGGRANPTRQLAAYIHAYPARLKEALANDYPALLMAIGEKAFDALAQAYLETHPSRFYSLRDFGGQLAAFITTARDDQGRPWLAELAKFEWSLGLAFDAADSPLAGIEDMAVIAPSDWPKLCFDPHPSLQRLDLTWNTVSLWTTLTAATPQPITAIQGESVAWLIWREQLTNRFRSLETDEQAALDSMRSGDSFAMLCDILTAHWDADAVPLRAATLLKGWLEHGLIRAIRHDDNT